LSKTKVALAKGFSDLFENYYQQYILIVMFSQTRLRIISCEAITFNRSKLMENKVPAQSFAHFVIEKRGSFVLLFFARSN